MIKAASNNAKGRFFSGFFTSPELTSTDSNPPNAKTNSNTVDEKEEKPGTYFTS
jgi:hypothetical protein